jgi:CRP/FNR family transcriptional regulator, nitrogen oxide reductase regulator
MRHVSWLVSCLEKNDLPGKDQMTVQDLSILDATSLFAGLKPDELKLVAQAARIRRVDNEGFFFMEQDPATRLYILTEGRIRLVQVTPAGQQVIMRYISPIEPFGVIAMLSETTYPVSAQAVDDSTALYWDRTSLKNLMEKIPGVAINALSTMADRVREFQDRIRELTTERVERRIARAILRLAQQTGRKVEQGVLVDLPITRQDIAEITGTTIYTVSRTMSQWESQGIIDSGREKIIIRRPHQLVVIAEDLP